MVSLLDTFDIEILLNDPQDHHLDAHETPPGRMPFFIPEKLVKKMTFDMGPQVDPN